MQRFKNLTKKSGKVASAILSAAMVTSMVLGTNVVEVKAATNDTETTVDVKSDADPSIARDEQRAKAAIAELKEAYKDLPVTVKTAATEDDFKIPAANAKANYELDNVTLQYDVTKQPESLKAGEAKLTITADAGTTSISETLKYTLASGKDRAATAKAAVQKYINEDLLITNISSPNIATKVADFLSKTKGGKHESIKLYDDVTSTVSTSGALVVTYAVDDKRGHVDGDINLIVTDETTNKIGNSSVTVDNDVLTNQEVINSANADLTKFIDEAKYFGSDDNTNGAANLKKVVDYFLTNGKYADEAKATTNPAFVLDKTAGKTVTGEATIAYQLESKDGTNHDTKVATAKTEDKTITLPSDETKAEKVLADLNSYADEVTVTSATTSGAFFTDFVKVLNDENDAIGGTDVTATPTPGDNVATLTKADDTFGPKVTSVTVKFIQEDATSAKDGKPTVVFTVKAGESEKTATKEFTIASAQTQVKAAKAEVEAALAAMEFSNNTTKDDVVALVNDTIAKYNGEVVANVVAFEKTDATADKEGTAKISVDLTDKDNTFTETATANKTFTFLSNTFVEKDGKKFYYDKDGKLLKNTFLQGTESPDGYTYYIQNDGSVMQDRLTYHPNGKDVIYFDAEGHEVFDAFVNVKKDVQGNAVDYIGYFGTLGGAYVNQTTYGNGVGAYSKDALFYINDYGVLENKGWFQNAAGNIGYAAANGTLTTNQWSLDQFGRKVYFQANGFLAKGLMTDGVKTYQLDETDGHLVGEF